MKPIYRIWGDLGTDPRTFYSREEAIAESRKLAFESPGYRFYVLKTIGHSFVKRDHWEEHEEDDPVC